MKNLKLILKSIINNNACVEGGRTTPWYISIIMLVFSLVILLIPPLVNSLKTSGEDFVKTNTYNYETGALRFVETLNDNDLKMTVVNPEKGKYYLEVTKGEKSGEEAWNEVFYNVNSNGKHCYTHFGEDNKIDFQAFYYDKKIDGEKSTFLSNYISENITTEHYVNTADGKSISVDRNTTFILFCKDTVVSYVYNASGTRQSTYFHGDYKNLKADFTFNSLNGDKKSTDTPTMDAQEFKDYREGFWKAIKTDFFKPSYKSAKVKAVWTNLLVTLGINVGIVFFMGLMLFILTRGKANPYRVYSFWDTQKMVYWATPTMAILAMIVGFIFSQFAQLAFPLLIGVRIMWMSMKSLNPQSGTPVVPKPAKQPKAAKNVKTVKAKAVKK